MTMGLDFENFVTKDFMKAIYFAVRCPKKPKVAPPMTSPAAIEIKAMVASAFLNKVEVMLMVRALSMKTVDIMVMLTKRELGIMMRILPPVCAQPPKEAN